MWSCKSFLVRGIQKTRDSGNNLGSSSSVISNFRTSVISPKFSRAVNLLIIWWRTAFWIISFKTVFSELIKWGEFAEHVVVDFQFSLDCLLPILYLCVVKHLCLFCEAVCPNWKWVGFIKHPNRIRHNSFKAPFSKCTGTSSSTVAPETAVLHSPWAWLGDRSLRPRHRVTGPGLSCQNTGTCWSSSSWILCWNCWSSYHRFYSILRFHMASRLLDAGVIIFMCF